MNSEEIVKGNKLIAEFMGYKYRFVEYPNPQLNCWQVDMGTYESVMQYHSSWDWLMPVVEKIEAIRDSQNCFMFCVDTGRDFCAIRRNNLRQDILFIKSSTGSKIKSVWLALIEFIQWYNKKQKDERSVANEAK